MTNPLVTRIRNKKNVKVVSIEDEGEKFECQLKPISTVDLIEHEDVFDDLPSTTDINDKEAQKLFRKKLLPMMKIFLPLCCVSPKVTLDPNDPELNKEGSDIILFNDIPIGIASQIFKEILEVSGLTKEADEARKNLQGQA